MLDAEALGRGLYRSLATDLASCTQRTVFWSCLRLPNDFVGRALDSRKRVGGEMAVEFANKKQVDLDQHGCPDRQVSE